MTLKMAMEILFLLTVSFIGHVVAASASNPTQPPLGYDYDSVYNFGDALSDTGNLLLTGSSEVKNLPYGMTFFGKPTGRFSNGRLIIDFIAEAYGLPYLQPYLAIAQGLQKYSKQGVNFAVAGATVQDIKYFYEKGLGPHMWTNHSLDVQLGWFQQLKSTLCTTKQDCREYFKKSLFFVGEIGGNDYHSQFFSFKTSTQEMKISVPLVVGKIANAVSVVIEEGASTLVVPGNFPIGCLPVYLTAFQTSNPEDYDENGCLKEYNEFAEYFNDLLKLALHDLGEKYPEASIVYGDYYNLLKQFVEHPLHYGFTNGGLIACCGGGGPYNNNIKAMCGFPGSKATTCEDPSTYVNWDGIHSTEATYHHIAKALINGVSASKPVTISSF